MARAKATPKNPPLRLPAAGAGFGRENEQQTRRLIELWANSLPAGSTELPPLLIPFHVDGMAAPVAGVPSGVAGAATDEVTPLVRVWVDVRLYDAVRAQGRVQTAGAAGDRFVWKQFDGATWQPLASLGTADGPELPLHLTGDIRGPYTNFVGAARDSDDVLLGLFYEGDPSSPIALGNLFLRCRPAPEPAPSAPTSTACRDAVAPLLAPSPIPGAIEDDAFCWWVDGAELRAHLATTTDLNYVQLTGDRLLPDPATGNYLVDLATYNPGTPLADPYCVCRAYGSVWRVNNTFPPYWNGFTYSQPRLGCNEGFWFRLEKVRTSDVAHYRGVVNLTDGGAVGDETLTYGEYPPAPAVPSGFSSVRYLTVPLVSWVINDAEFFFGPNAAGYGLIGWNAITAATQITPAAAARSEQTTEMDFLFKVRPTADHTGIALTVWRRASGTTPWTLLLDGEALSGLTADQWPDAPDTFVQVAAGPGESHTSVRSSGPPPSLSTRDSWRFDLVSYSRRTLVPVIGSNDPFGVGA